jgi:hypothetical protein
MYTLQQYAALVTPALPVSYVTDLCQQHRDCVTAGVAVTPRTDICRVGDRATAQGYGKVVHAV